MLVRACVVLLLWKPTRALTSRKAGSVSANQCGLFRTECSLIRKQRAPTFCLSQHSRVPLPPQEPRTRANPCCRTVVLFVHVHRRYHSHVKSCSACRGALAAFTRLRDTCRVAALAAVAAAAGLAAAGAAVAAAAGAATTTATAASIGGWAAAAAALAAVLAGVSAWAAKMVRGQDIQWCARA